VFPLLATILPTAEQTTQAENQSKGSDSAPGSAFERAYTWNGSLLG